MDFEIFEIISGYQILIFLVNVKARCYINSDLKKSLFFQFFTVNDGLAMTIKQFNVQLL